MWGTASVLGIVSVMFMLAYFSQNTSSEITKAFKVLFWFSSIIMSVIGVNVAREIVQTQMPSATGIVSMLNIVFLMLWVVFFLSIFLYGLFFIIDLVTGWKIKKKKEKESITNFY
ncbi:hypothetical protein KY333_04945 [Candidatus Woesearchaeota archaeon]|nr:hypothetical protein [Candidatus Woesearchaeota archaeon]